MNLLIVSRSLMLGYAVAVLATALALLVTFLLESLIQPNSSSLFLAAVMFSAWYGGLGPGLLSTVLSTLASVFFFEPPVYALEMDWADIHHLGIFVLLSLTISSLNAIRLRSHKALHKSEEQIRLITDSVPTLIAYVDAAQRYCFNNQAYEQWFGHSRTELTGKHLRDVQGESGYQEIQSYVEAALSGQEVTYERVVTFKDGRQRYLCATYVPDFGEQQQVKGFVALVEDISNRRQTEEALRQSEERLWLALDAGQMGIWDWNLLTDRVTWSKNHELLFGMAPGTFEGTPEAFIRCVHPEDRAAITQAISRTLSEGVDYDQQFRVVWDDGSIHWIAGKGQVVSDNTDKPMRIIGTVLDITKRKQTEELGYKFASELEMGVEARTAELFQANVALEAEIAERQRAEAALYQSQQQFKAVVENTPDVIIRCDRQLRYVYVNPAVERNTGRPAAELIGKTSEETGAPPELCQLWNETMLKVFETGIEQTIEFQAFSVWGLRTYQSRVVPEVGKDGSTQYVLIVARDITEIKQAEEERAKLIREQAARLEAEIAQKRSAFLVEASTVLASSLDYETTLKSVARLAVPFLADWCAVDLVSEQGQIRRVEVAHINPTKVDLAHELHRRYPPEKNPRSRLMEVLRTGKSEYVAEIPDSLLVAVATDNELLEILRELNLKSYMLVPLRARGRTLGAMTFVFAESNRRYQSDDLALAEELACRAALAVDNALLYRASEAARSTAQQARAEAEKAADRTARLQAVTAALSQSLTPSQVAEVIAEQGVTALGADCAFITRLTENGTELEVLRASGVDEALLEPWRRFSIDAPVPLAEAVRTGKPIWPEPIAARIARYPHLATKYRRSNDEAWLSLPLMIEGRAVGGMSLSFREALAFSEDERAFALTLAQQCAQALERARLYEAEQSARAAAEAANRTKDEFLATLSHELRTPLNAMLGWTKLLRTRNLDEATVARALETIDRNTKSLATLIEDVLDVSRIITGKLPLNVRPIELTPVIEAAIDAVKSAADAKDIQVEFMLDPSADVVLGDPDRLQQVVWNLLSNAIKFTPKGGRVEIEFRCLDSSVQIRVSDTGKGISLDFLPYVFDRFRQENSTTTRIYGGLGLGLAIVRHLVELHGGTVRAESPGEGQGATFIVDLPLRGIAAETNAPRLASGTVESEQSLNNSRVFDGLRLLVVDDEADARELLIMLLEHYGAEVTAVSSVSEALEAVTRLKPHVLISDIGMPYEDGYALIRQLRAQEVEGSSQLPALALTAYAREEDRLLALEAGFHKHLPKPVEPNELVNSVAQLAGRSAQI